MMNSPILIVVFSVSFGLVALGLGELIKEITVAYKRKLG
tara:strand:+ start:536 stop:652 length:117 start_codon:yes stop_codon:yes gene_type:complete